MKKLTVIVTNYSVAGESYGLLGPQMAATIVENNTDYDCLVVAVGHDYEKISLKSNILNLFRNQKPVIGFGHLGGRVDLWELAKELKSEGAITILGGPQADVDFRGEIGWEKHDHYFPGLRGCFSYAIEGPAEQLIPLLKSIDKPDINKVPGLLYIHNSKYYMNERSKWDEYFMRDVRWDNLYRFGPSGLEPIKVTLAQVVQQIGCPYAAKETSDNVDYPNNLNDMPFNKKGRITLNLKGCSFCDVARDKGFGGKLSTDNVLAQIANLPQGDDRRKIPFELINEQAVATLPQLISAVSEQKINISQINLVNRTDWFALNEEKIRESLNLAKLRDVKILLSQVGFESFSDSILRNLNKGYSVDINLKAVKLMRQLKEEFPDTWFYSTQDGAYHGFIHPTPWDSADTMREMNTNISIYGLMNDILPPHNTPLLIHHACGLGDWIREFEKRESIQLQRAGSLIMW